MISLVALVFPAIQLFGKAKPRVSATVTMLPANASGEEIMSSMMDSGLYRVLVIIVAGVLVIGFGYWAYSQLVEG